MGNTFRKSCGACLMIASLFAGTTNRSSFYAVHGLNFAYDGPLDTFVIAHIARQAARCSSFSELSDSCKSDITQLFRRYFTAYINSDPAGFDRDVIGNRINRTVGQVCLFGFENSKPVLIDIRFFINKGVKHHVVISCSGDVVPSVCLYTGPIPKMAGPVGNFSGAGGVEEVKRTISFLKTSKLTGGPAVDILVMTKSKTEWLSK